MRLQSPLLVVTPTLDGPVLKVLAGADAEFTISQIHDLIGQHSHAGVRKAVYRLVDEGIASERSAGRKGHVYSLNRSHLCAPAVIELATTRERFLHLLRQRFAALETQPTYAALFGSAARGDMTASSDIDIFVVRPAGAPAAWDDQLAELTAAVAAWTGNDARVLEFGEEEFDDEAVRAEPVLSAISREGITLSGPAGFLRARGVR